MKFLPLSVFYLILFEIFFLLSFLYFYNVSNPQPIKQNFAPKKLISNNQIVKKTSLESAELPLHLKIPAINVDAIIQHLGIDSKGNMEVPNNIVDVGWFSLGPRPGEIGSAVIAGHLDGKNSKEGVFTDLNKLKKGDKIYIEDTKGISIVFVVRESRVYDPGYAEEVFSSNNGIHLNLITCNGIWERNKKSYSKRLVVFTDKI
jgi:sortase A